MKVMASDIARYLGKPLVGSDLVVECPSTIQDLEAGRIAFAKDETRLLLTRFVGSALIISPKAQAQSTFTFIESDIPRSEFARILNKFFPVPSVEVGIHSTAIVDPSTFVDPSASVGPFCVIGRNSSIGAGTVLDSHGVIGDQVRVGQNCRIGSHSVVGKAGFGIEHDEHGMPFRIPHSGGVLIEDFVQIGNLVSIAQGTFSPTHIEHHVMIDDHVFIAHNVRVRSGALIIAGAEISGSVDIGAHAWISPQVTIRNGLTIGERAIVGIGAVVVKNVGAGETVMGNPAKPQAQTIAKRP
jgi:UDP-3-O-[3-hydroxymyristoyl] glucosamine N-acyltransferase LpxD